MLESFWCHNPDVRRDIAIAAGTAATTVSSTPGSVDIRPTGGAGRGQSDGRGQWFEVARHGRDGSAGH